jgi:hypothetical protein
MTNRATCVMAAGLIGALCWSCAERPARRELLTIRQAVHVGMRTTDVLDLVKRVRKDALVGGGDPARELVLFEGGSSVDWILRISFCQQSVVAVRIHSQDSPLEHPKGAPPDEKRAEVDQCG